MDSFSFDDELLDELSSIIFNGADDSNNTSTSTRSDEGDDLAAQIMNHAIEIIDDDSDLDLSESKIRSNNNNTTSNVDEDNTASTTISDEDEDDLVAHIMKQIELIDDDIVSKNTRTTSGVSNTTYHCQQPQQSSVAQQNQTTPMVVFVTVTSPPPQIQIHHNWWNLIPSAYAANGAGTNPQKHFFAAEERSRSNNNKEQTNGTTHSDVNKISITNILKSDELKELLHVLHSNGRMHKNGGTSTPRIENCLVTKKRGRKMGSKNRNGKSRRRCGQCKEYQCRGRGMPGRAGCEKKCC